VVAERIRKALPPVSPERLFPCTDCGLVPRSREAARNNPLIKRYLGLLVSNVIGADGIQLQSQPKDQDGKIDKLAADSIERAWREDGRTYRAFKAQGYMNRRRRVSRRNTQFGDADWALVERLLREDWSPEQIVGRCARVGAAHTRIARGGISHERNGVLAD